MLKNNGMREYMDLEATPNAENCAQTGSTIYDAVSQQKIEIEAFKDLVARTMRKPPQGFISWSTHSNPHDFGTYLTLRCHYNESDAMQNWLDDVSQIEHWDATALQFLNTHKYAFEEILGEDRLYQSPKLQS